MVNINKLLLFAVILLIVDIPFVMFVMGPKYKKINLGNTPNIFFAICAYMFMIASWFLFEEDVFKAALTWLVIYGTYAGTLGTIYNNYNLSLAATEVLWGTFVYAFATSLTNLI